MEMPNGKAIDRNVSHPNNKFVTPKKIRRRPNGSPITPLDPEKPVKTIYLIRHGQSQGQAAHHNGMDRHTDPRLRDCGLTKRGESEAANLRKIFTEEELEAIQLVVSSPLTRALHTALLGFPTKDIIVNFDLREVGSKVPENSPRVMKEVIRDLQEVLSYRDDRLLLDITTLQPHDWPRDYSPRVLQINRILGVCKWLYEARHETVIAVVCHYNVIRSAVTDATGLRPMNAIPIRCKLHSNGELVVEGASST